MAKHMWINYFITYINILFIFALLPLEMNKVSAILLDATLKQVQGDGSSCVRDRKWKQPKAFRFDSPPEGNAQIIKMFFVLLLLILPQMLKGPTQVIGNVLGNQGLLPQFVGSNISGKPVKVNA